MAIVPLDLQTLFAQVDKVGKAQAAQREGMAMQQAIHGTQLQQKAEKQISQVNEAQNSQEGSDKVKDRRPDHKQDHEQGGQPGRKEKSENDDLENNFFSSFFNDPNLGKKIDISL